MAISFVAGFLICVVGVTAAICWTVSWIHVAIVRTANSIMTEKMKAYHGLFEDLLGKVAVSAVKEMSLHNSEPPTKIN